MIAALDILPGALLEFRTSMYVSVPHSFIELTSRRLLRKVTMKHGDTFIVIASCVESGDVTLVRIHDQEVFKLTQESIHRRMIIHSR